MENVVSGFSLGIDSCIISGALEGFYLNQSGNVEKRLKSRPFPQITAVELSLSELWTKYSKEMIFSTGIAIFIFGNKLDNKTDQIISANGMVEEFDITIEKRVIPIPVGVTEFIANELWGKVMDNFDDYVGLEELKPLYNKLGNKDKTSEELVATVIKIINVLTK